MGRIKIIITGGGTGGHIFPGIALADQLISVNPEAEVMFVGSKIRLGKKIFKNKKYAYYSITAVHLGNNKLTFWTIFRILRSMSEARKILKKISPQLVISVGGYPAASLGIIARIKKIPLVVCEQNILPGITNRLLFPIADRIYASFRKTKGLKNNSKTKFFGNPLRRSILRVSKFNHLRLLRYSTQRKITILVLGGSQGAHAINIAVMEALEHIDGTENLRFIHQSGLKDEQRLRERYFSEKIDAQVKSFFDDVDRCYDEADVVICRAGATTLAELTAIGRCSLIIPYPFAAGNHQLINAQFLVNAGGAEMIIQEKLNGPNLARHINEFINNPKRVTEMASKAKALGMNRAAELISTDIYKMLEQKGCI